MNRVRTPSPQSPAPQLDIQRVAIAAAAAVLRLTARVEPRLKDLGDQASRAVARVPLNLEEGLGRTGRDRQHLWRIAYASCRETSAAVQLLVAVDAVPVKAGQDALELLDRVQAMNWRLLHPRR